jgi:hypothetical protein
VSADAVERLRQSWQLAEARLYPLAMTDVDGYQRSLVLVAALCDRLRVVAASPADLVACQGRAAELVAETSDATGASARGLSPDDLFGAAAALRDRELAAETRRMERLSAIDQARAAQVPWAELHTGDLGVRVPHLRIDVATGRTVITELSGDPVTAAPVLLVAAARVDVTTGELHEIGDGRVVGSVEQWERVASELLAAGR